MKKALIVVDVQYDFCSNGALEVKNGDHIIPVINKLIKSDIFDAIVYTQDWHPDNHKSFASNNKGKKVYDTIKLNGVIQVLWPDHCVQRTRGSRLHRDLKRGIKPNVFKKGKNPEVDSYSGFYDNDHKTNTGLSRFLLKNKIEGVYVSGLATDYCVKYTALDSVKEGFKTFIVRDAVKGVNLNPGDVKKTLNDLKEAGVKSIYSHRLLKTN